MNAVTETKGSLRDSAFTHVLVGVDGSEESREAVRQAATVADSGLTLLAAYDVAPWIVGDVGYQVPAYFDEDAQRGAAMEAVLGAREDAAAASPITRIVGGRPAEALIAEAEREQDTLLVVGSDGHSRLAGFVLGLDGNGGHTQSTLLRTGRSATKRGQCVPEQDRRRG